MPPIHGRRFLPVALSLSLVILALATHEATAQFDDILGGKGLTPGGDVQAARGPESLVSVSAHFTGPQGERPGILSITARIEPPWYTYSTTQKPLGATPTIIKVESSNDYRLGGEFRSTLPPRIVRDGQFVLEEHHGEVTWQAPLEFREGVRLDNLKIDGSARIQVCKIGACLAPTEFKFTATYQASAPSAAPTGRYAHPNIHATLHGYVEPRAVTPGETAGLVITAEMPKGWHVYELASRDAGQLGNKPTLIAMSNTSGFQLGPTTSSQKAVEGSATTPGVPARPYYEGRVTWTVPIVIPDDTKPGTYPLEGFVGYQTCFEDARCDAPRGARFEAMLDVATQPRTGAIPLAFSDAKYGEAAAVAASHPTPIEGDAAPTAASPIGWTLPIIILAGLVGGFILNFMPCVLPVIGLKVLSFAEQAGRSRGQILKLNVWYSLGTLSVLWVLAILATSVSLGLGDKNLGWGEQF
ncbi:MAG: hypothetical protein WDZ48_07300, partial [Pirellulales bacterium]